MISSYFGRLISGYFGRSSWLGARAVPRALPLPDFPPFPFLPVPDTYGRLSLGSVGSSAGSAGAGLCGVDRPDGTLLRPVGLASSGASPSDSPSADRHESYS